MLVDRTIRTKSMVKTIKIAALAILVGVAGCATKRDLDKLPPPIPPAPVEQGIKAEVEPTPDEDVLGRAHTFQVPPVGTNMVGKVRVVVARYEDTLPDIARQFDLGYKEITDANPGVDPWLPGEGTRIVLPTQFILPDAPRTGVVINVSEMRLFYYPPTKAGQQPIVITHPIGIGREGWDTPIGTTKVISKLVKPVWHVPPSVQAEHAKDGDPLPKVVPPGPDNPLGEFAMRLGIPGYLIHGTNKPYGIGMRISHGCVHLYPEDISEIFEKVAIGTPVRIVSQGELVGQLDGVTYLSSYQSEKEVKMKKTASASAVLAAYLKKTKTDSSSVDWNKTKQIAGEALGIPIQISRGSPTLVDILATAPEVHLSAAASVAESDHTPDRSGNERTVASPD